MDWRETSAMLDRARAEEPVTFDGPKGALYGILTPSSPDAPTADVCIVFPGRPRYSVRRLMVMASRILAADGFTTMRFDLSGHGESAGDASPPIRTEPLGEDVAAAIDHLRKIHGQRRFLLAGYCFDAMSAFDAFNHEAGAIDGMFFAAATVLEERATMASRDSRNGARLRSMIKRSRKPRILECFESSFKALAKSRARALFLYGEEDRLRAEFRVAEERLFSALDVEQRRRIAVEMWPGRIHTIECQPAIFERAISWLREFHPAASTGQSISARHELHPLGS